MKMRKILKSIYINYGQKSYLTKKVKKETIFGSKLTQEAEVGQKKKKMEKKIK